MALASYRADMKVGWQIQVCVQWNPSKADTIGTKIFVCYSEVSLDQVDHAHPTITASYDKALATMDDEKDERSVN